MAKKRVLRKRQKRKSNGLFIAAAVLLVALCAVIFELSRGEDSLIASAIQTATPAPTEAPVYTATPAPTPESTPEPEPTPTPAPTPIKITISAAGDCTLGGDMNGSSEENFRQVLIEADDIGYYTYCFQNVADIFEADDLTIVNLEVVLTDSSDHSQAPDKQFIMRGDPRYVNMLTNASVEIANIANNHMTDFDEQGIRETRHYLGEAGVKYCGYGFNCVAEVEGVKVGFCGFNSWTTSDADILAELADMRARCDILIATFHWGSELEYKATDEQKRLGHMAVDAGADLVLGHHPHIVNGIEIYKGVNIIYSLGNFCFGGNKNPKDKDTFIYQHTFEYFEGELMESEGKVIPCYITSVADQDYNNFQPTPAYGDEAQRILLKIESYSRSFGEYLKLTNYE